MNTSGHLDWLEVTYPCGMSPHDTLPRELLQSTLRNVGNGSHGYHTRLSNDQGVSIMLDGSDAQGVHLTLPGSVLWALRDIGATDKMLCEHVVSNGGKVSRIDTAVNIHAGKMTVDNLRRAYVTSQARTKAHSGLSYTGHFKSDNTLTIGSRISDRYFRAYDKRVETGVPGEPWLRLELEAKHNQAKNIAKAIAGTENTRAVINKSIKNYVDFPTIDEYVDALADNDATIEAVPRKMADTLRWLIEIVAPAMANYEAKHPGVDTGAIFITTLSQLREQRGDFDAR